MMRQFGDKEEKFGGYDVLGADAIATIPLLLATMALVLVIAREVAMGLGVAALGMLPAGMVPDEAVSWDPAILGGPHCWVLPHALLIAGRDSRDQQQSQLLSGMFSCCDQYARGAQWQEKGFSRAV